MLTTRELQDEIIRLKKEKDICILALWLYRYAQVH